MSIEYNIVLVLRVNARHHDFRIFSVKTYFRRRHAATHPSAYCWSNENDNKCCLKQQQQWFIQKRKGIERFTVQSLLCDDLSSRAVHGTINDPRTKRSTTPTRGHR
jgi:hypothetical protein